MQPLQSLCTTAVAENKLSTAELPRLLRDEIESITEGIAILSAPRPYMEAVHKGRMNLVRALCDAGVHPSEGNADDYSSEGNDIKDALLLAAEIGPERLQAFMHPFIYNMFRNSLMCAVARFGHESVMRQLLLTSGRHYNALLRLKLRLAMGTRASYGSS